MRKTIMTLVVAGLVAGGVATVALAADTTTTTAGAPAPSGSVTTSTTTATDPTTTHMEDKAGHQARKAEMLASKIDALTTAGTLTDTEAHAVKDALTAALQTAMAQTPTNDGTRGGRPDDVLATTIDALVTQGTLTAEKAQAVRDALAQSKGNRRGRGGHGFDKERNDHLLSATLDSLVTQGKLTAEQAQTVKDAMTAAIAAATTVPTV